MNALADLLSSAPQHLAEFQELVRGIPYERKGIPNSEMFFLWLCAKAAKPRRILESGRARGQSTLILARCFPDAEIISVEHDANSPDVAIAAERLKNESNVKLLFGDATRLLPELAQSGDLALIDGPKGFRGIRFSVALLATGKLPLVFVHDAGPGSDERTFFARHLPQARYSDEMDIVRHSHALDDEEAMDIPPAHRYAAVSEGTSGVGYGYGLACLPTDSTVNYSVLRFSAIVASVAARFGK